MKRGGSSVRVYIDLCAEPFEKTIEGNISGEECPIGDIPMVK